MDLNNKRRCIGRVKHSAITTTVETNAGKIFRRNCTAFEVAAGKSYLISETPVAFRWTPYEHILQKHIQEILRPNLSISDNNRTDRGKRILHRHDFHGWTASEVEVFHLSKPTFRGLSCNLRANIKHDFLENQNGASTSDDGQGLAGEQVVGTPRHSTAEYRLHCALKNKVKDAFQRFLPKHSALCRLSKIKWHAAKQK